MPRNARCYDVLIASPGDVQSERQIAVECIEDWNTQHSRATEVILQPRRWEFDAVPETGDRPQAFINRQIVDRSDLLIGIFWSRLGSSSSVAPSGTVEEIDRLVAAGKPAALYFSTMPLPYNVDPAQLEALREYKERMRQSSIYFEFQSHELLRRMISIHLGHRMHQLAGTPVEPPQTPKTKTAALSIRLGNQRMLGGVRTMQLFVEIENLSRERLREYSCDVSVPRAALTHSSGAIWGEINSKNPNRRVIRFTEMGRGQIMLGDTCRYGPLDLGIDQLKMKGTHLEGDYDGTLADKVFADAVINGEVLHAEMPLSEIFVGA
jgi:hypothetical protein